MFSHIPTKLTLAGRVSVVLERTGTVVARETMLVAAHRRAVINLHVKTHRVPYTFTLNGFLDWATTGKAISDTVDLDAFRASPDDDKGMPHAFPDILRNVKLVVISSCPNALFLVPDALEMPTHLALIFHFQCTLVNHSILSNKYDLLSAQVSPESPAMGPPAMLPCYIIDRFRVAMPAPEMLFAPFAFTETSNLDAFAIVHTSTNPNRSAASSSAPSGNADAPLLSNAPVLPSWLASWFRSLPNEVAQACDTSFTTPLLLDMVPTLDSTPPATVWSEAMLNSKLFDLMDSMGLDGRFVAQAGLRGPDAKRVLASHVLGELLVFTLEHRRVNLIAEHKECVVLASVVLPLVSIMYWTLAHRAANHPLCVQDPKLRAAMHSLANHFFGKLDEYDMMTHLVMLPADVGRVPWATQCIFAVWHDFLAKCSVSRFMYTWLDENACDVATVECQQVLVDTFMETLREMLPETRDALCTAILKWGEGGKPALGDYAREEPPAFDFDTFVVDVRFGFHRSALRLYTERLIDRTRHHMTPKERDNKNKSVYNGLRAKIEAAQRGETDGVDYPDPEKIASDENNGTGGDGADGDAEPVHDASYYTKRGAHGNGHLFLKAAATDAPFGDGSGRMWRWCSVENNREGHSPIVIDEDPSGRKGIDLRVTAYSDHMAMVELQKYLSNVGTNFYANRGALRTLFERNRAKVFSGPATITLSDATTLKLSDEQMKLFDCIANDPGLLIAGGAGVGKSTLIAALLTVFNGSTRRPAEQVRSRKPRKEGGQEGDADEEEDDEDEEEEEGGTRSSKRGEKPKSPLIEWLEESPVVLLMAYGKVASNFTRQYGMFASTVHFAAAILNRDFHHDDRSWRAPSRSPANAVVAIVDEITVQSLVHMTMLRNAFPRLMKLIVVGDIQQMSCIDRGAVGDALVRIIDTYPDMKVNLTHNYRLTNQSGDDLQLEARTLRAFAAITRGSVINDPTVFGPYSDAGRGADLPAICVLNTWDPATVRRALKRAPILLLPHLNLNQGPLPSLRSTCDALVKVIGNKPADWDGVQLLSQRRREEVGPITAHISGLLFKNLPKTQQGDLPASDLCVGEKAVFKKRVPALSPNGSACFIYTNDMRIIAAIEDADETIINPRDRKRRQVLFKNQVTRKSTREYVKSGNFHSRRVRLITFTDGYRVSVPYQNPMGYKLIDFFRRGLCVTNASMQGSSAETIVTYIRPEVSHTLDRRQFYTSVSRMRENCIIISAAPALEKVVNQLPQARNDHLHEFLKKAFEVWAILAEEHAAGAPLDVMESGPLLDSVLV